MGAGKGQTRRVQGRVSGVRHAPVKTKATKWVKVKFNRSEWAQFLKDSRLANVNIYKYYLGSIPSKITFEDYDKVLTELFADAVEVGAVVLPEPYKAADFRLEAASNLWEVLISRAVFTPHEKHVSPCRLRYRLRKNAIMPTVSSVVRDLARSVGEFLTLHS